MWKHVDKIRQLKQNISHEYKLCATIGICYVSDNNSMVTFF